MLIVGMLHGPVRPVPSPPYGRLPTVSDMAGPAVDLQVGPAVGLFYPVVSPPGACNDLVPTCRRRHGRASVSKNGRPLTLHSWHVLRIEIDENLARAELSPAQEAAVSAVKREVAEESPEWRLFSCPARPTAPCFVSGCANSYSFFRRCEVVDSIYANANNIRLRLQK